MRTRCYGVACLLLAATVADAAARPPQQILADIAAADHQIDTFCVPRELLDPKYRLAVKPILMPLLVTRQQLYAEWQAAEPAPNPNRDFVIVRNTAERAYLGDETAVATLTDMAASPDPAQAAAGNLGLGFKDWCNAHGDAAAQAGVLDRFATLVADRPADPVVAFMLNALNNQNPATPALAARVDDLIATMKTPFAIAYKARPNQLGKPLKIVGTTVAGKPFDLSKWKGKVVMIDFWATWCPPCMAELPAVAETYKKYHDQGLEILGVSSDQSRPDFTAFLKQHPEVAWPQLCVFSTAWHPLTKAYGINGIPTVYLIDRNGLLRSMTARGETELMIPQLLAEAADAIAATRPVANASITRATPSTVRP